MNIAVCFFLLNGVPKNFRRPLKNIKFEDVNGRFAPQARKFLRYSMFPDDFLLKFDQFELKKTKIFTKSLKFR